MKIYEDGVQTVFFVDAKIGNMVRATCGTAASRIKDVSVGKRTVGNVSLWG